MTGRVSVCAAMIVRDEQHFLPGCLASLTGTVDEIVIVDTGSRDATIDIASSTANVRLLHHPWTGDFAAARNRGLDAVRTQWVLYIDADERLNLPSGGALGDYIDAGALAGLVRFRPKTGYTRYREWRLFRNDPRLRFEGRIHETVEPVIRAISAREGLTIQQTEAEIDHLGYDGVQAHKHARNLGLLEEAVRIDPDRAYLWQHLTETLAAMDRPEEAKTAALAGLAAAARRPSDKQNAAASLITQFLARRALEAGEDPLALVEDGLARLPEDHALTFLQGRALLAAGRPEDALAIAGRLAAIDPDALTARMLAFDRRIFEEQACELAAVAALRLGRQTEAAAWFDKAARFAPDDLSYRLRARALAASTAP
ncbi:glycosyltransferase [Aestuariivirga sp. YIM B02566]|uniref:Glycosyltransferase n=1 Tax=Taklimakanibacter albus TaxID=2800327 RepID=A0ACC5RD69_9HYPH|nr:glycosyltransferase [Aestuariivirga sp. YIM B02566]MBK1870567.1 glycosyltransferase [Aestuariivirga sp. YIM B02566]